VDRDRATALEVARISIEHGMAMADRVTLATADRHRAAPWTQDSDFDGLQSALFRKTLARSQSLALELAWR